MVCSGLAVVTKGPLGLLVPGLAAAVAWVRAGTPRRFDGVTAGVGLALFAAIAVPWYAVMTQRFGTGFLRSFFVHENWERLIRAEHGVNDRWYYYPAVIVVGSIPWWPALAAAVARAWSDARRDPAVAFLWGWIVSSLAFFTLAHSKLPTYVLFVFVPLALLAGRAVVAADVSGPPAPTARAWARGAAVLQVVGFGAAAFVPLVSPVRGVLWLVAAVLAVGAVLLWRDRWSAWVATTAAASAALLVPLLTSSASWIESMTSTRASAAAVAAALAPGEPLLCERLLVRGLTYYSGATPDVLAGSPQPYFSPHPLVIVVGSEGLGAYLRRHGRTLCLIETERWPDFAAGVPAGWTARRLLGGEKSLFLIEPARPAG
jgi:4-amino-4-deoxy-L-arabinose transferase-like glycosyltransferase